MGLESKELRVALAAGASEEGERMNSKTRARNWLEITAKTLSSSSTMMNLPLMWGKGMDRRAAKGVWLRWKRYGE